MCRCDRTGIASWWRSPTEGFRLTSTPIPLYPRAAGTSKFAWTRIPVGVLDLLSVWFQLRFGRKPMLFFGLAETFSSCLDSWRAPLP